MRLTMKIATSGTAGLSRFPVPDATIDECTDENGRFDEAAARAALDCQQIQIGSKDDRRVIAFTMEYLRQLRSVVERLAENINADKAGDCAAAVTDEKGVRTEAQTPADRRCERNMEKGRVAYVRLDITGCRDGIHAKLSVANPRETVGGAEAFAREYAVMCARILVYLRANITTAKIALVEGEGAAGVFADAEDLDRRDDLAKMRGQCERLHNGSCSPCKFDCPLYESGKCRNPAEN